MSRVPAATAAATPRVAPGWSVAQAAGLVSLLTALLAIFGWLLGPFDLQVFLQAARHVVAGADPYASIHGATFRTGHSFVYPYLVAWAFVSLAWLPPGIAAGCYLVLSVAAIIGACHALGKPGLAPAALVLACSMTVVGLQMGTLNAFLFAGIALAWSRRHQPGIAGVTIGLVAVAKLFLLPMIGWLLLTHRYRAALVAVAVFAATLTLGSVFGPLSIHGYFHLLSALDHNEAISSWSLASFFETLGVAADAARVAAIVAAGGVLLAGGWYGASRGDQRLGFSAAVVASLLLSPVVWSSYLLLLMAPLLLTSVDLVPLASAAMISWAVVTPDAASSPRVGLGIGLAALVALLSLRSRLTTDRGISGSWLRSRRWRWICSVTALGFVVLVAVPAPVRNALPALLCAAAVLGQATMAITVGDAGDAHATTEREPAEGDVSGVRSVAEPPARMTKEAALKRR